MASHKLNFANHNKSRLIWGISINQQQSNIEQKTAQSAIGIFDSGVGGLTVVQAIQRLLPNEDLIYVADTQFNPYGNKTDQLIEQRVSLIAEFLSKHSVKAMVVACNTATAAAIEHIRAHYDFPIIGLEPALKPAFEASQNKTIGVLATQSTLQSAKYQKLKQRFSQDAVIIEKASPLLVELVENQSPLSSNDIKNIEHELQLFTQAQVDSIVLGCTHYPFLSETIQSIVGLNVRLFESGLPVALELKRRLANNMNTSNREAGAQASIRYFSSASEQAQIMICRLLSKQIKVDPLN
jgi:glutamate racemase